MLVRCIKNYIKDVADDHDLFMSVKKAFGGQDDGKFSLEVNKNYVVYGLEIIDRYPWYYLCDENYTYYAWLYPAPIFEVVDTRLSRFWTYGYAASYEKDGSPADIYIHFTFKEWIEEKLFADKLLDGNEREKTIFSKYKELMDVEFLDPDIANKANVLDGKWVMCPLCDESWEASLSDEMTRCPKCLSLLINSLVINNEKDNHD